MKETKISTNKKVKTKLIELYDDVFTHNGYGEIKIEIRILHRGQKEIILHCGKQYRFIVNYHPPVLEQKVRK